MNANNRRKRNYCRRACSAHHQNAFALLRAFAVIFAFRVFFLNHLFDFSMFFVGDISEIESHYNTAIILKSFSLIK